jgi:two-component system C4-dicarboxylate transport response regulator DctD
MTLKDAPPRVGRGVMRVFLAEDDPEMRRMIAGMLRRDGHFVLEAKDGPSLLVDLQHVFLTDPPDQTPSLVITDVRMPGEDGLTILEQIQRHPWRPPFILITAFGDRWLHEQALRMGAHAVLDKPFDLAVLRTLVAGLAGAPPGPAHAWA